MSQEHSEDEVLLKRISGDFPIVSQEEKVTTKNKEDNGKMGFEESKLMLEKAQKLQCEGQEYIANLASDINNIFLNVNNVKEFAEFCNSESTIDFPNELIKEFNQCLEKILRVHNIMRNIEKNKKFSVIEKMKELAQGIDQMKDTVEDVKTQMDRVCLNSTHQ